MSRLRWPESTNSVSEKPGTIHIVLNLFRFLMLPLYAFTPEVRRAKEMERDLFKKPSN